MSILAIQLNNVSKTYRIYDKPIDRIKESLLRKPFHRPFEGLRDISFAISAGESVGIVGENGAGKSTLLNIIAGILTPTGGDVITQGRVAALLELGAGFNHEFTGRENIGVNASVLGLSGSEIREMEHAIIEFAELERFIDLPLKTYSSGMVMRLGFSVATCVNPDILIVDEALSVGDQYFQEKCIDWMTAFQERDKTILFCSHALFLVNKLCERAIWIDRGAIREKGSATRVTASYEDYLREKAAQRPKPIAAEASETDGQPGSVIRSITLNGKKKPIYLNCGDELKIVIEYESFDERPFWITAGIRRNDDLICHAVSMARDLPKPLCGRGVGNVLLRYPSIPFLHGEFSVVGVISDESELLHYGKKESDPFYVIPPEKWLSEVGLIDLAHEWELL